MATLAQRELPGALPSGLPQIYNGGVIDPQWQKKYTIIWTSVLALTTLASIPWILTAWRNKRLYAGLAITETLDERMPTEKTPGPLMRPVKQRSKLFLLVQSVGQSLALFTVPFPSVRRNKADCSRRTYFSLGIAQWVLIAAYAAATIACATVGADFSQSANRPAYIAVATLPLITLLALKSPLPLPVFLPSLSYEHYNFLHRWAGRTTWLATTIHMGSWINQWRSTGQWDQIWKTKSQRGYIAYAMMCLLVVTSLKPVRRKFYQLFWMAHITFFVGFFVAVAYHTTYATPWVYPCIALYAYDHFVRLVRYRIKDATIVPLDSTMTMIHIPDCDAGWLPTQHVFLRVLRGPGAFEAHPFTIANAPFTALSSSPRGITLYAKVAGDWTRRLHSMASDSALEEGDDYEEREAFMSEGKGFGQDHPGRKVKVMIDGPYGGLKVDLGAYENVLLVGGGSGVTFLLGAVEDCLSWRQRGRGPRRVTVAWVVRDDSTIEALAPTFSHLFAVAKRLGMELEYDFYLTDATEDLSIPSLPAEARIWAYRPEVSKIVCEILPTGDGPHGGLAVVAAGPEGLVMEARNAVATLSVAARVSAGGVTFHDEVYCL